MVKTLPFGSSGLKVNSPGFGAMGLSFGLGTNLTFKQAEPVLLKAIEPGCTFWDTAVVYAAGINESLPRNLPSLNTISAIKSFPRVQNAALRFSKKKELRILQNISRDISMVQSREQALTPDFCMICIVLIPILALGRIYCCFGRAGKTKCTGLSECFGGYIEKSKCYF